MTPEKNNIEEKMMIHKETADEFNAAALKYHSIDPPGKIALRATKPMGTPRDLSLAYTPGVAVAKAAMESGVAKNPIKDFSVYHEKLTQL